MVAGIGKHKALSRRRRICCCRRCSYTTPSLSLCISLRESCTRQLLPEFLCNQCWLSYIYDSPLPRAGKAQVLQLQREIDKTGAPVRVYLSCCDLGEKQEEEKKQSKEEEKIRNTRGARAQAREERGNGSSKRVWCLRERERERERHSFLCLTPSLHRRVVRRRLSCLSLSSVSPERTTPPAGSQSSRPKIEVPIPGPRM